MPNPLTTDHFPIPVRVENEPNVYIANNNLKVVRGEHYFSAENTHKNGQTTPAYVEIVAGPDDYLIEYIAATISGPNQVSPEVFIVLNSGITLRFPTNHYSEKVQFLVKRNERIKIYISGHSTGTPGETTSSIYVLGRVLPL